MAPRVSIILPTYNGEADLTALLPRLAEQACDGGFEIVAVDSSSADGSRGLLERAGARLEVIPKAEFRHGRTRNRAAERAQGEVLVFLSQDALPRDRGFLAALAAPFDDPRVAGAYARALPREGEDPLTARTVLDAPEASERARTRDLDGLPGLHALTPAQQSEWLRFNNVASAIRASVFRDIPFPDVPFGEDFAWAARALTAGWRIAFVPGAVVYHAHSYSPARAYERNRVDAAFHRLLHGHRVRPSLWSALRGMAYEVRADLRYLARHRPAGAVRYALYSPLLRGAQVLGQWVGSHGWLRGPSGEATGRMR